MLEKDLVKKIMKYLSELKGIFCWKEHGGMYGTSGIPDIIVCYKGRFIAFECKVGGNKTTPLQAHTIKLISGAGGIACVVRTVEEVKSIMKEIERRYNQDGI